MTSTCCNLKDEATQIIASIFENEIEEFKEKTERYPVPYSITDDSGNNILQLSITLDKFEIFTYILSKQYCDVEAKNDNKQTALVIALTMTDADNYFLSEEYSIALIKSGAKINTLTYDKNTLLHLATRRHFLHTAQLLIDNGIAIDAQNDSGCTPLHTLFDIKTDPKAIIAGVDLFLYYGADTSICDHNGNNCFELAICYDSSIITAQRNLFFHTFDSNFKYQISSEVLFELLDSKSPLFFEIWEYISEVEFLQNALFCPGVFFHIESDNLEILINQFDYVIRRVFSNHCPAYWYDFAPISWKNWELLLTSHLAPETIDYISNLKIDLIILHLRENGTPDKDIFNFIFYLLSFGLNVSEKDLDTIYKTYGYCNLFKTLLFMEIQSDFCDIVPKIIYDIHFCLDDFLEDPHNYSINALGELMSLFSRPKLQKICYDLNVTKLVNKVKSLPKVPSLIELSRDSTRKYLIGKYEIKTNSDFFTALNLVPISVVYKKIISFESKLYY